MSLLDGILEIDLGYLEKGLKLHIYEDSKLFCIDEVDALENGESRYQLKESSSYEYELLSTSQYGMELRLECPAHKGIVKYSKRKGVSAGRITTGNFVGTLNLDVGHYENAVQLEVLATKFNDKPDDSYRKNYKTMLADITEQCTELLMQANSPISQQFEVDPELPKQTIYQQFSFIHSLVNSEEFDEAVLRIFSSPKTSWSTEEEELDVRRVKRFNRANIRQLATRTNRTATPESSAVYTSGLKSVPTRITSVRKVEEYDNAENRFVKHALTTYLRFFEDCAEIFDTKATFVKEKREAKAATEKIESYLQHPFFYDISRPQTLNIGSPVLQRKSGYRFVLRTWLMSELASKLIWEGGDDVYSAGKKDIATLYEYWIFFQLYKMLQTKFDLGDTTETHNGISSLLRLSKDELHLSLKQGSFLALNGTYKKGSRLLRIKFAYNRSFKGDITYDDNINGSWTNTMRPDYTISLWPAELDEVDAEKEEQIVHIHFDAKYKVEQFMIDSSTDEEHLNEIKNEERAGTYKNADILKMHAYKDAIRRTGGAYILYPGTEQSEKRGFHEIIPGLGAFALNPNDHVNNLPALEAFLDKIIAHLLDRSSQREHIAVKRYEIHKSGKKDENVVHEPMPEYVNGKKLIPDETYVLIGFSRDSKRTKWYEENGLYNFRMNDDTGSLEFHPEVVNSTFLLLRESGKSDASKLYKLKSGLRVFSGNILRSEKYKHPDASKDSYLVYSINSDDTSLIPFKDMKFDFKKLAKYQEVIKTKKNIRVAAGIPFAVTLTELMKTRIK